MSEISPLRKSSRRKQKHNKCHLKPSEKVILEEEEKVEDDDDCAAPTVTKVTKKNNPDR